MALFSLCLSPPGGADWYHQTQPENEVRDRPTLNGFIFHPGIVSK